MLRDTRVRRVELASGFEVDNLTRQLPIGRITGHPFQPDHFPSHRVESGIGPNLRPAPISPMVWRMEGVLPNFGIHAFVHQRPVFAIGGEFGIPCDEVGF